MLLFLSCHYCSKWRRPWSWRFAPFKVQDSTPLGCNQSLRITPLGEKPAIYPVPCRKIFEDAMHGTEIYFLGVGPKGHCRGSPILKKKKKMIDMVVFLHDSISLLFLFLIAFSTRASM
jgi:hypothetical protein